jgi:hypothetical protein
MEMGDVTKRLVDCKLRIAKGKLQNGGQRAYTFFLIELAFAVTIDLAMILMSAVASSIKASSLEAGKHFALAQSRSQTRVSRNSLSTIPSL